MNPYLKSILTALLLTLAVELIAAAVLRVRKPTDYLIIALVNCLTNPIVNIIYYFSLIFLPVPVPYFIMALLEVAVVFTEALLFSRLLSYKRLRPIIFSLILNASSFAAGWIFVLIRSIVFS